MMLCIGLTSYGFSMEPQMIEEKTPTPTSQIIVDEVVDPNQPKQWADIDTNYTRVIGLGSNCCTKGV
jgi:hypothetical protein